MEFPVQEEFRAGSSNIKTKEGMDALWADFLSFNEEQVQADKERLRTLIADLARKPITAQDDAEEVHPALSNMDVMDLVYRKATNSAQVNMTKVCALWGSYFLVVEKNLRHWFEYLSRVIIRARRNLRGCKTIISRDGRVIVIEVLKDGPKQQAERVPFDGEEYISDEDFDEEKLGPNLYSCFTSAHFLPLRLEGTDFQI